MSILHKPSTLFYVSLCVCAIASSVNSAALPGLDACQQSTDDKHGYPGKCVRNGCCEFDYFKDGLCPERTVCCYSRDSCEDVSNSACNLVNVVSRSKWYASAPNQPLINLRGVANYVIIHQTHGETCKDVSTCAHRMRTIQQDHVSVKGFADIGLTFLIGGDANVYEGRGWKTEAAQNEAYNNASIALAFIGNFNAIAPNSEMMNAAQNLIACGVQKGLIAKDFTIHGHKDANCINCPGNALYSKMKTWNNFGGRLPVYTCG